MPTEAASCLRTPCAPAPEPNREMCYRCFKPDIMCVCSAIRPVRTRFRILILQHPQEARRTIGTARIVTLSVPGSRLLVGIDFTGNHVLMRCLKSTAGPAYLIYPERGAPDVTEVAQREDLWPAMSPLFVLIDGTWAQARKIKNQNPILADLPRVCLSPDRPSEYRIRRQPRLHYLSTVEAAALLLTRLDGPDDRSQPLLDVFQRMVQTQLSFRRTHPGRGVREPVPRLAARSGSPATSWPDLP
jgi:DTW domain-containing protein YfiP